MGKRERRRLVGGWSRGKWRWLGLGLEPVLEIVGLGQWLSGGCANPGGVDGAARVALRGEPSGAFSARIFQPAKKPPPTSPLQARSHG